MKAQEREREKDRVRIMSQARDLENAQADHVNLNRAYEELHRTVGGVKSSNADLRSALEKQVEEERKRQQLYEKAASDRVTDQQEKLERLRADKDHLRGAAAEGPLSNDDLASQRHFFRSFEFSQTLVLPCCP